MNENNALYHHGIKGQKWGIRRFEDENISVQGKMRVRDINKLQRNSESVLKAKEEGKARIKQAQRQAKVEKEENKQKHTEQRKKIALAGAAIVGGLLLANAISKRNNGGSSVVPPTGSTPKPAAVKPAAVKPISTVVKPAAKPVGSQTVSSIKKTTASQTGEAAVAQILAPLNKQSVPLAGLSPKSPSKPSIDDMLPNGLHNSRINKHNVVKNVPKIDTTGVLNDWNNYKNIRPSQTGAAAVTNIFANHNTVNGAPNHTNLIPKPHLPKRLGLMRHDDEDENELYHRDILRWPAGSPDGKGGQFMANEDVAYADAVSTILKRKADKLKLDPLDKKDPDYEKKKKQIDDVYKNMLDREFSKNIEKQRQQYENKQAREAAQQAKTIQDIGKIITDTANLVPRTEGKRVHPDYSNITDDEMNKYINRANLETRYAQAKGEEKYIKSGSEKTREALQTIGAIAGIGGSIAMVIANLRRKNN